MRENLSGLEPKLIKLEFIIYLPKLKVSNLGPLFLNFLLNLVLKSGFEPIFPAHYKYFSLFLLKFYKSADFLIIFFKKVQTFKRFFSFYVVRPVNSADLSAQRALFELFSLLLHPCVIPSHSPHRSSFLTPVRPVLEHTTTSSSSASFLSTTTTSSSVLSPPHTHKYSG